MSKRKRQASKLEVGSRLDENVTKESQDNDQVGELDLDSDSDQGSLKRKNYFYSQLFITNLF